MSMAFTEAKTDSLPKGPLAGLVFRVFLRDKARVGNVGQGHPTACPDAQIGWLLGT